MPQKTWAIGEETLAVDFNSYVQNQVVPQFATVATRDAQWTAPPNGAMCVTTDTNTVWQRVAGAWYATPQRWNWNTAWGLVAAPPALTADQSNFGQTALDVPGAVINFTATAGRWYCAEFYLPTTNTAGGSQTIFFSLDGAVSIASVESTGAGAILTHGGAWFFTAAAGARVAKLRATVGVGSMNMPFATVMNGRFAVRDVGPSAVLTP